MSISYKGSVRDSRMQAVIDAIGTGGWLRLYKADATLLAEIQLPLGTLNTTYHRVVFTATGPYPMTSTNLADGRPEVAKIFSDSDAVNPIVYGLTVDDTAADVVIEFPTLDGHPYLYSGYPITIQTFYFSHAA